MMKALSTWFVARSSRERLLLRAMVVLVLGVGAPLLAWRAAADYRGEGRRALDAALQLQADAGLLAALQASPSAVAPIESDGTARGMAVAAAAQVGLTLSRIEPDGPSGVLASFEPASAIAVYRWIDTMERGGMVVTGVVMVRAGEGDVVGAQTRASPRPA